MQLGQLVINTEVFYSKFASYGLVLLESSFRIMKISRPKKNLYHFRAQSWLNSPRKVSKKRPKYPQLVEEVLEFMGFLKTYGRARVTKWFFKFEKVKDIAVNPLYRKRGKYARPFVHSGMIGMLLMMMAIGPVIFSPGVFSSEVGQDLPSSAVLGVTSYESFYDIGTTQSDVVAMYRGGEVVEYEVADGDTVSSIAQKFDVSDETILWANDLTKLSKIKVGQKINILPVTGVLHTVKKGETVFSVAKKYGLDGDSGAQAVVDYPFNSFVNDEKFTLAVGQQLVVPGGAVATPTAPRTAIASRLTPDAGVVSPTGSFVWPAKGRISQGHAFYHQAIDIANKGGGRILAADAGVVIVSGWPDNYGYGNRVVIDHGNGFVTLYAHMSALRVKAGQSVNRGDVIGDMGSTGRSTGTHLHFEIRQKGGGLLNPLTFLR